jgi:PAS domain S-box-containing protein
MVGGDVTSAGISVLVVSPSATAADVATLFSFDEHRTIETEHVVPERAADAVERSRFDCVCCLHDPPTVDGLAVLSTLRDRDPDVPVVLATESEHADSALDGAATDVVQVTESGVHEGIVANRIERLVSEARELGEYEATFDRTSDGIAVFDAETGDVLRANDRLFDLLGERPASEDGPTVAHLAKCIDGYTPAAIRAVVREVPVGGDRVTEWRTGSDGDDDGAWLAASLEPVTLGHADRVLAFVRDVTERKRREKNLRDSRRTLRRLHEITSDPALSFDEQVERLMAFGADRLDLDIGFLSRIDEESGHFEVEAARGDHELIRAGREADLAETYCRHTISEEVEAPLAVRDAGTEMAGDPAYERFGLGCYLGAEIEVDGDLYGTLCFADEEARNRAFSDEERTLIDLMAQWLRRGLEQREYRRRLETTRDRLSNTLERIEDGFFAVDRDWRVTYVNDAGASMLLSAADETLDGDELVGRRLWEVVPEAVGSRFYEEYHEAKRTGETVTFEEYYDPLDVWLEVRAYPDDEGISVYFTDVTERKERERTLEELLRASRAFIRAREQSELVDAIIEGVESAFEYEVSSVRLHDAAAGTLPPTAVSTAAATHVPDPPTFDDATGPAGEAFQTGEPTVVSDLTELERGDYGRLQSALFLPMGDHGLVGVGSVEADAFGDADVALFQLLAVAAANAFDRLEREAEMRALQRVVERVDQKVFLLDDDGRFTYVTAPLGAYLGVEREALVGEPLSDVVAAEDGATCADALATVRTDGSEAVTREVALATADGERRPVELSLSATAGTGGVAEVAGVVTDISALEAARTHLESERERFQELFENLPDPVIEVQFVDGAPVVEYANPAFTDVFGFDPETVRGANLNELVVPEGDRDAAAALDAEALSEGPTVQEVQRESGDGQRDFLLRGIPYARDGETYGFAVYTDITEQRERERYQQVLNRVLRHNLRNDMNVVMALAERIAERVRDDDLAEHARTLLDNARDVASLSEKAKEIERVLGRRGAESGAVDAATCARRAVSSQREANPNADISTDLPEELWVRGDRTLERACEELVENAVEHAESASPRLTVTGRASPDADDWVELRFVDDGPGIPDGEWNIVTGEEEISQLTHGSGLGLWLTRWIVESHDGDIVRDGTGPDGATVVVRLRRAAPEQTRKRPGVS